jgi:hypothetical protein
MSSLSLGPTASRATVSQVSYLAAAPRQEGGGGEDNLPGVAQELEQAC